MELLIYSAKVSSWFLHDNDLDKNEPLSSL